MMYSLIYDIYFVYFLHYIFFLFFFTIYILYKSKGFLSSILTVSIKETHSVLTICFTNKKTNCHYIKTKEKPTRKTLQLIFIFI